MRVELKVICDCGNMDYMVLKRTTNALEGGHVYEDYSSITNTEFIHGGFKVEQYHEDTVEIICNNCFITHEITT